MAIQDDLIYELNERGENVVVKSINSDRQAFLRFTNRTSRLVDLWWRDFGGRRRHYERMEPGAFYDINSYLTHPWEFTDAATGEQYVINNKYVFRAPNHVGDMLYRTNWNITIPVRSLRATTMLTLASLLRNPEAAESLDLPMVLTRELSELVTRMQSLTPVEENADAE
nr:von Hippel-Lindau disease tumor suppressor [Helicoverpa armigera]